MTDINIKMEDAFNADVCCTGIKTEMSAHGLSWRHFVINGYKQSELEAVFGTGHPIIHKVVDHMKQGVTNNG